jgi:glycine oxidase
VVGAGIIGLAVAWRSAQAGLSVLLVDPEPGRGASWAAGGMLAPVAEAAFGEEALTRLALEAARAWPGFAADLEVASGLPVHFTATGTLMVAADPSDRDALERVLTYHRALDLAAERLTVRQARHEEPLLAPGTCGGLLLPGDHHVDNRQVVEALLVAVGAAGVTLERQEAVEVVVEGGRAAGVRLGDGTAVAAGAVVVAAGSRSGLLAGIPAAEAPPVRPVRGVTLRLASAGTPQLRRTVRALVHGRACYLVPRPDGGLVVGATVEERGFDLAVPLGGLGELIDDARRVVPALDEYHLVEVAPGLRPGTPDNGPIVGSAGTPGLHLATGHHRNGILLAPLTADDVVAGLTGAPSGPGPLAAFRPDRFAGPVASPAGGGDG